MKSETSILQLNCPACGARLESSEDIEIMYCRFCGQQIMLDNESRLKAKVALSKQQADYELERLRMTQKAHERSKNTKIYIIVAIVSLVIALGLPVSILGGFAISSAHETKELQRIESQIEDYYASGDYDMALFKANQLVYDNAWGSSEAWDKKREAWIELIEKAIERENKFGN